MSYGALIALDGASGGRDADPAPARVLPVMPIFRLQPVLDDDAAAARRAALSIDAERDRAVRSRRRFRRDRCADRRPARRPGLEPAGDRGGDRSRRRGLLMAPTMPLRVRRWRWRFWSPRRSRSISASRRIWSSASAPSSRSRRRRAAASMASISASVRRRRARLGHRRLGLRARRLDACLLSSASRRRWWRWRAFFSAPPAGENEKRLILAPTLTPSLTPPSC